MQNAFRAGREKAIQKVELTLTASREQALASVKMIVPKRDQKEHARLKKVVDENAMNVKSYLYTQFQDALKLKGEEEVGAAAKLGEGGVLSISDLRVLIASSRGDLIKRSAPRPPQGSLI